MSRRRILAPIDYSHSSRRALSYALAMMEAEDAELTLLHVGTLPMYVSPSLAVTLAGAPDNTTLEALTRSEAEKGMAAFLSESVPRGRLAELVEIEIGDPTTVILDRLRDHDIGVIGTHGRRGVDHLFIGSVAEKVVRAADKPVVTVNGRTDRTADYPPRKILVPVDFSEGSRSAYAYACTLAQLYAADVELLHVLDRFPEFEGVEAFVVAAKGDDPKSLEAHARESVAGELQLFLRGEFGTVDPKLTVATGSPHLQIVEHATSGAFDLVVMGTHGRSGWSRFGVGSVAERVVRTSEVPVLTIRDSEPSI